MGEFIRLCNGWFRDIWIYYRDIGLMDTPVERDEIEAPPEGFEDTADTDSNPAA